MKKLVTMMGLLVTAVVLTACGSDDDVAPESGGWNDDLFVNESLGFQFQLPRGWNSVYGDDLAEALGMGATLLSEMESELPVDEILEAMEDGPIHDMFAVDPFTGATAQVMFQRLPRAARRYSSEEALDSIIEAMEEEMPGVEATIRSGSTTIGNYEYYSADIVVEAIPGVEMLMQKYLRLEGRNAIIIAFTSVGDVSVDFDEILYFFNEPGAPRIEIEELATVEESDLIGTWVWNMDEDYVVTFNADGTGIRGYVIESLDDIMDELVGELGQALIDEIIADIGEEEFLELMMEELESQLGGPVTEEFEWEIANDILYIDLESVGTFGVANEEWEATIDGDVLSIESLQAPDLRFSYIRQ